jgi:hypothetical protein
MHNFKKKLEIIEVMNKLSVKLLQIILKIKILDIH